MAIAINLTDLFDIQTYDGLVDYIIAFLELDAESAAQVPNFIRLGEKRLDRILLSPLRESEGSLSFTAGDEYAALPTTYRQLRRANLAGEYPLSQVAFNLIDNTLSGKPQVFALANQSLYLSPVPDAAYTVSVTYMAKIPELSTTNQTNWLLQDHPDAYLFAALLHATGFIEDKEFFSQLEPALLTVVAEINRQGQRYRNAGPIRLRSPVVV